MGGEEAKDISPELETNKRVSVLQEVPTGVIFGWGRDLPLGGGNGGCQGANEWDGAELLVGEGICPSTVKVCVGEIRVQTLPTSRDSSALVTFDPQVP